MKFIKIIFLGGLMLVLTSACQYLPVKNKTDLKESTHQEQSDAARAAIVRLPNPYLDGRVSVPKEAKVRFEAAKQAMRDKNWAQAQFELEWLTTHHVNLSGPFLTLAMLYRQLDEVEKAETAFNQAITINSKNVDAYNQYGIFLREQGRFDDALKTYTKALDVWPDHPQCQRNLGILYDLYFGKPELALPHYKRYQLLLDEPDQVVTGWIVDTERRIQKTGQAQ